MKSFMSYCRKMWSFPILLLFFITSFSFYFYFFNWYKIIFLKMYMYNKVERLLWLSHYLMVVQLKQFEGDMFGINDANKLKLEWNSY